MRVNLKKIFILFILFYFFAVGLNYIFAQQEPSDKMLGFSLANFDQKNRKTWDLEGETLEILDNIIHLTKVKANMYGEQENMLLVADKGSYDRNDGKVHLEDNVVITSDSGAKMMTDTLDWLQKSQLVKTEDKVNIYKDNMQAKGLGANGKTDLKQFTLEKEVQVDINSEDSDDKTEKTTIICDGPLDMDYEKQIAIFHNNVKADNGEQQLFADKMTGYFDKETKKMVKAIAEGNVKIIRGKDVAYSQQAIYDASSQKISLIGRPQLIIYSTKEEGEEDKQQNQEQKQENQENKENSNIEDIEDTPEDRGIAIKEGNTNNNKEEDKEQNLKTQ